MEFLHILLKLCNFNKIYQYTLNEIKPIKLLNYSNKSNYNWIHMEFLHIF